MSQIAPRIDAAPPSLPLKVAVLVYLYDAQDRLLLLHRVKPPNPGRCSPIGGKVEVHRGESPHECAIRETFEEAGLELSYEHLRLSGIVSERAYEGQNHWMIFLFESTVPVDPAKVGPMHFDEGHLEWVHVDEVSERALPDTDRRVMWPAVRTHRGGFFMVQIDCTKDPFEHRMVESVPR